MNFEAKKNVGNISYLNEKRVLFLNLIEQKGEKTQLI